MTFLSAHDLLRRLAFATGAVGTIITALSGCGGGSSSGSTTTSGLITPGLTPFTNTRQATASACVANAHTNGRARWTVLVYINAASNLQDDSNLNVGQMASVGSDSNLNIIVQWKQAFTTPFFSQAGIQPDPTDIPSFVGTRRYRITQHTAAEVAAIKGPNGDGVNGDVTSLRGDLLPAPATNTLTDTDQNGVKQPTADMGNWQVLREFVQWGITNYPADNIAVVIWDHGSAALSITDNRSVRKTTKTLTRKQTTLRNRSVSFDTNTGSQITTQQIASALTGFTNNGKPRTDLLIIDCSLEGSTEVAYQVRNVARGFVASEESPPAEGLAYDGWLAAIKSGGQNPCIVGNSILSTFLNSPLYQNDATKQSELTLSLTDLAQMQTVIQALDAFGSSLRTHLADSGALIATTRNNSQAYDVPFFSDYKDLYDFADRIRNASTAPVDLKTAATNLETALVSANTGAILASVHGNSATQAHSTGLTIHFPLPGAYESEYDTLAISQSGAAPNWALFLKSQTQ